MMSKNRNKDRGKAFERKVAKIFNGKRYPADTGGPIDVVTQNGLYIQCKYTKNLSHQTLEKVLMKTRSATPEGGYAAVVHQIPPGPGKQSLIMFTVCLTDLSVENSNV